MSASGLFSWTGISFKMSRKILDYAKDVIDPDEQKQIYYYDLFELIHNSPTGNWTAVKKYDEELVAYKLKIGECWHAATYVMFLGYIRIDQGRFKEVEALIGRLSEIWTIYGNENATEYQCYLKIILSVARQNFHDALKEADAGISLQSQTGRELAVLYCLGYKAIIQIHLNDISGAEESLQLAREFVSRQVLVPPNYISSYLIARFLLDLYFLENADFANENSNLSKLSKKAHQSGKKAMKNSEKYAYMRVETLRLMGIYYWLTARRKKALKLWSSSVQEAKHFGSKVQLAKTYKEIGKRLFSETRIKLNGLQAEQYLEKAGVLFEEMGLLREQEDIDKIFVYR
jgi:hypothetical protein